MSQASPEALLTCPVLNNPGRAWPSPDLESPLCADVPPGAQPHNDRGGDIKGKREVGAEACWEVTEGGQKPGC
jgi:hypothetical protein